MTNVSNISVYISLNWENCRTSKFYEVFFLTETNKIKLQDELTSKSSTTSMLDN